MLTNVTYQKKCLALLIGFVLFLVIGYKLAFSKTFELKNEITIKEQKIKWLKEKEKDLPFLKAKMDLIEKAYSNDTTSVRDKLTASISEFADNNSCTVTEIPSNSSYLKDNLLIQTNTFTIKGQFHDLLRLIYLIETEYKISAKIMSARFYSIKEIQNKRKNLYLTLITQSFKQVEKNS